MRSALVGRDVELDRILTVLDPLHRASGSSPRERELLALLGRWPTDKQSAVDLVTSPATVRSHLDHISDKTGRRRPAELTPLAVELGLSAQ